MKRMLFVWLFLMGLLVVADTIRSVDGYSLFYPLGLYGYVLQTGIFGYISILFTITDILYVMTNKGTQNSTSRALLASAFIPMLLMSVGVILGYISVLGHLGANNISEEVLTRSDLCETQLILLFSFCMGCVLTVVNLSLVAVSTRGPREPGDPA